MDLPKTEELSKLLDLCNRKGVQSIRLGDLELKFKDEVPISIPKKKKNSSEKTAEEEPSKYSEEDLLFWSTPGLTEKQEAI